MVNKSYYEYIYQIDGETLKEKPESIFDASAVYLIIDKNIKLIWIWAGKKSRLFHRYMAANWAGKLKSRQQYYSYKYEVIKQGREPLEFISIINELTNSDSDLTYPGQSRKESSDQKKNINLISKNVEESSDYIKYSSKSTKKISQSNRLKVAKLFTEVLEIQSHIKYSIEHLEKRIIELRKLIQI